MDGSASSYSSAFLEMSEMALLRASLAELGMTLGISGGLLMSSFQKSDTIF